MLYHWYELGHAAVRPARVAVDSCRLLLTNPFNPLSHTNIGRHAAAACEVFERTTRRYDKPEFAIRSTEVDGVNVAVREEVVWQRPFCRLIHFERELPKERADRDPRILLVAPMSGHFATLLRGTVETLLPSHEVFITDWQDARDVPLTAGRFDLDDYIDYLIAMFRHFGGDVHVFAVCQPSVPAMAAVSVLEQENDPDAPHSLILAGGPIDTRISPTAVNKLAERRSIDWFRSHVVTNVPWPNLGFGRAVYPGFLQLTGFMTMNLDRHLKAHKDLFLHLVHGDGDSAEKHREFYDEYLAVMDLTAEFYLQTIETVFMRHALPFGTMRHRERTVDPAAINRVAMMTIEGEKDDITGLGQCRAALDLARNLAPELKLHYECPGVGHYGVFNGSRFRNDIAPRITQFVTSHDPRAARIAATQPVDWHPLTTRARDATQEMSSLAFTFAAANDAAPDPAAQRLKAQGLGATTDPAPAHAAETRPAPPPSEPQSAPYRLFALAGNLLIDGLFHMHTPSRFTSRQPRVRDKTG